MEALIFLHSISHSELSKFTIWNKAKCAFFTNSISPELVAQIYEEIESNK